MTLIEYNAEILAVSKQISSLRHGKPISSLGSDGDQIRFRTLKELNQDRMALIKARNKKFRPIKSFAKMVEFI